MEAAEAMTGEKEGAGRASWWLLAGCLLGAGGLGAWEVRQRWRSKEEGFVVPVPAEEEIVSGPAGEQEARRSRGRVLPRRGSARGREVVLVEDGGRL